MRLLDANVDVHLARTLTDFGVPCDTAANRGWKALGNGDLVATAFDAGFRCLLTRDQLFGESAARALKDYPGFAVVVVNLPQRRSGEYQQAFAAAWALYPIVPLAGFLIHWPPARP